MRVGRTILIVATLATILVFPLLLRDTVQALRLPSAYAAPGVFDTGGRAYRHGNHNGNHNKNGNGNHNSNKNHNDNGNHNNNNNGNGNGNKNNNKNENGNGNHNRNDNRRVAAPAPSRPPRFMPPSRRCFDVQEVGDIRLNLEGGSVTVRVVPPVGFPQRTWVELDDVESLSSVPAPPAGSTILGHLVWRMEGGSPCDGPQASTLSAAVNLGIPYSASANKSRLQIVILKNGVWQEVPTTPDPDPSNPYISATIQETGIYAVIQNP